MANEVNVPRLPVATVDRWLTAEHPTVEAAVARIEEVRQLAREARIAEAHLIGYVRERFQVDDFSNDPEIIDPDRRLSDE